MFAQTAMHMPAGAPCPRAYRNFDLVVVGAWVRACAHVPACVAACVRACVRACVCQCVRVLVCLLQPTIQPLKGRLNSNARF